jgi:hypothetical protein
MTSRQWILRTVAAIALILCVNFAVAIALDPYGIFREPRGRKLTVAFAGRKAKFLLSKRYVPANYDSLLIGPSSSENWDPASIPGVTMYNESILGSNVVEEKRIVDQALPARTYKLAICILYPTMTSNHAIVDGLDAVSTAEALGSIHLYIHELAEILTAAHRSIGKTSDPNGTTPLKPIAQKFDIMQYPSDYFRVDPIAMADYTAMVQSLEARGARIVYVIPPLYEPCRQANAIAFDIYKEKMAQNLPQAPTLDLSGPDFAAFRANPANYVDCFHVNADGARQISAYLAQNIR